MTEKRLIQQAKLGNKQAFETLVQTHAQQVYTLALRTLKNEQEAEDIAQETFVRAWRSLPRFRGASKFSTWLYRITTNLCYNRLPKLRQELNALDPDQQEEISDSRPTAEQALLTTERNERLQTALENLPDSYRLLITLRHIQGLSYDEIASVTKQPLGTVKTGIFRARRLMRLALEKEESK